MAYFASQTPKHNGRQAWLSEYSIKFNLNKDASLRSIKIDKLNFGEVVVRVKAITANDFFRFRLKYSLLLQAANCDTNNHFKVKVEL